MPIIAICDDEPKFLIELDKKVRGLFASKDIFAECLSTTEPECLLKWLEEKKIAILLLDIDMPRINGLEIAKKISDGKYNIILIFITNQEALVYDSFQYHPFAFIRKSRYEEELASTIDRALLELNKKNEYYTYKNANQIVRLLYTDILYFEADGNYVKIVTKDEAYQQRETLISLELELVSKGFIRIHKGYLVNQEMIFMLKHDKVILTTKEELPIGRANKEKVKKELMRYMR